MTLKLSRVAIAREPALARIDAYFARKIADEIGPLGALHMLKRIHALSDGALVNEDRSDILERASEQDERLAVIEKERLALKRRVRAASTVAEINAMLAELA